MNKQQFKKALEMAHTDADLPGYLSPTMDCIAGCALDTKRRWVTLPVVASLIRGHCLTFAGTWDYRELSEIEHLSKRFDLVETA